MQTSPEFLSIFRNAEHPVRYIDQDDHRAQAMRIFRQQGETMAPRLDSTLQKGLRILETLATSRDRLGITDLASQLQLNKSNVHRLVKTLCALDYVTQDADRRYGASFKLWKLGSSTMSHANVVRLCMATMNDLGQKTGESVHLSVLEGLRTLYIEKIDSAQSVRAYTERGGNAPLHCVATGKMLLAYNYEALRGPVSRMLQKYTPKTIVSVKALDAEIENIRAVGFATNLGEYRADVGGIAAPICDGDGKLIAAIGISGPLSRLSLRRIKELAPVVVKAAKTASASIKQLQA
jgi:DNA-binding IclR family transcriptional regulator